MSGTRRRVALLATIAVGAAGTAGAVAVATSDEPSNSRAIKKLIDPKKPKNVILLVGDGMGDAEVTLAKYYGKGARGTLNMETLPFTGSVTTWNLTPGPGPEYLPNYVPDSAPTGTAWSTGKKTIDARLSQGPSEDEAVPGSNEGYTTTFEVAKRRGMRVGNVTTSEYSDATPAAPSSHISQRRCQGPEDTRTSCPAESKGAGGLGSIVEQQADHVLDVNLGGGKARWEQTLDDGSGTVLDYAAKKGFRVVDDAEDLAAVTSLRRGPILGLFNAGNMTTEYAPLIAAPTPGAGGPDARCTDGNRPANEPSLPAMTAKAISLLERNNRKGFFLQVEGASIDKRDHASDVCGQIGETLAFDRAVGVALEYPGGQPRDARDRDRRPRAHQPDRRGRGRSARLLRDAADGRRCPDPRRLRHGQDSARPGSHGCADPGHGDRATGVERARRA